MPTYLVTDKTGPHRVMVEAARPSSAVAAVVADRFSVSPALEAADALRLSREAVPFIEAGEQEPAQVEPAGNIEQPAIHEDEDDVPEFREVDEYEPGESYTREALQNFEAQR